MTDSPKRNAFVLMPFAVDFADVYEYLIRAPLERAGYITRRADDLLNQRSILEDIVKSIADADLVVADLTSTNANVYYELGLAHALKKPVVLLAQDIGEVPFDLRPYRIIQYSTHFSKINEALLRFENLLREIHEGTLRFGSPFTDYESRTLDNDEVGNEKTRDNRSTETVDELLGFLDYQVMFEGSASEITAVMVELSDRTGRLAPEINSAAEQLSTSNSLPARAKLHVAQRLGAILDSHASWMKSANEKFRTALGQLDESLSEILDHISDNGSGNDDAESFVQTLDQFEGTMTSTGASVQGLRDAVVTMPQLEKTFNVAINRLKVELDELIGNFEQCLAMVTRWRGRLL